MLGVRQALTASRAGEKSVIKMLVEPSRRGKVALLLYLWRRSWRMR